MSDTNKIIYTKTDEAPALATYSFLPIVKAFCSSGQVDFELKDISLAARILAHFPENLTPEQRVEDALSTLGSLCKTPQANIIKLPNISASIPQLKAAIKELQAKGYKVPNYPDKAQSEEEKEIQAKYAKVLGSAVNPVLREGNSDRRVALPVKQYAKDNPHRLGQWSKDSSSDVAHMDKGDFYASEKSHIMSQDDELSIVLVKKSGEKVILKEGLKVLKDEIIDAAFMSSKELFDFFEKQVQRAKKEDILFSVHLKATMMKVSDPIMFGHAIKAYFKPFFDKYADKVSNPNNGLATLMSEINQLSDNKLKEEMLSEINQCMEENAKLAMVDSDKGITNLHVPSDVIIDASMPAMIKTSGKMWAKDGKAYDALACIPDRSYAGVYKETINFCKAHGAFDVKTMGNVSNIGLMAKKAQEYGSHDKTFQISDAGVVEVRSKNGSLIFSHDVEAGDIWRMCQTKDIAVKDWVGLGVKRARQTGQPAIFWLDENRGHDKNLISKVNTYLKDYDTSGLEIKILSPVKATEFTLDRVKKGLDTISVTGNVLRDYLTDLFPILELGTSAKMLSIVPLLAGGGLYETGAGGSAPKHVQQFVEENHLRWDSLGEFLALQVSLFDFANKTNNNKAKVLALALDKANGLFLKNDKSPSRKVGELDNRGSHFYLALYWAQALSEQNEDLELKEKFTKVYDDLKSSESQIINELAHVQGNALDIDGYYFPDEAKVSSFMRPSQSLNKIIDSLM